MWTQSPQIKVTHVNNSIAPINDTMDQINTIADAIIKLDTAAGTNVNEDTDVAELIEVSLSEWHNIIEMMRKISSVIGTSNKLVLNQAYLNFLKTSFGTLKL